VVEQDRSGRPVSCIEDHDQTVDRYGVDPGEATRHLDGEVARTVEIAGLHVDLALGLGDVEMDHAGEFGTPGRVRHERSLDDVDQRRHVERRAHLILIHEHNRGRHRWSLPGWLRGSGCQRTGTGDDDPMPGRSGRDDPVPLIHDLRPGLTRPPAKGPLRTLLLGLAFLALTGVLLAVIELVRS